MKKRVLISIALLMSLCLMVGCFSYKDMNRLLFYTMGVMDKKDGEFYLYGEAFKAYRGEGEKAGREKRIVLFGKGDSFIEAVKGIRNGVNLPLEYAGAKAYVMTKDIARDGIKDYLDCFDRDQKVSLRMYLIVLDGDAAEFIKREETDEKFMGLYLYEMMNTQNKSLHTITCHVYDFLLDMNIGSGVNILPIIKLVTVEEQAGLDQSSQESSEDQGQQQSQDSGQKSSKGSKKSDSSKEQDSGDPIFEPYVIIDGAAIFLDDKMVAELTQEELDIYHLLFRKASTGVIVASNPQVPDKTIGLVLLNNKYSYRVVQEGDLFKYKIKVTLRVALEEAQDYLNPDDEVIRLMEESVEKKISLSAQKMFTRMQQENVDLFNIKRQLDMAKIQHGEDYLQKTVFEIEPNVIMDSIGTLKAGY
ncbi:Ger(x)C family spore germination protein [Oscillospiraceae bacterium MB08-C2-2]|nr:Ger(x)C family spore germination protein [Oscillospiraceae bacterium MB08-C2-2]